MNGLPIAQAKYVPRAEEDDIKRLLGEVQSDHMSRCLLLYGHGGIGKTSLVRHMSETSSDDAMVWIDPIDVDDPECWLASNLERRVADKLDRGRAFFGDYRQLLSQLPTSTHTEISHETILSYLGRIREVFTNCYNEYVTSQKKTVVIVFDTVETIRGTNLLLTLTQWMKALPRNTLFILSGRPPVDDNGQHDQIEIELRRGYRRMPLTRVDVGRLAFEGTREFIRNSGISKDLVGQEEDSLVLLSRGQPLWLAFMVDYLKNEGMPPEAVASSFEELELLLPFDQEMTPEGQELHEAFLRRLVAPYREADFWHEAIKRMAIVRQPIAQEVWQQLMSDRTLPDDVPSMDAAWKVLQRTPWIRDRRSGRFVTLHDAVAEEFAQRLFPLHDKDQRWRRGVWRTALEIYRGLAAEAETALQPKVATLDEELKRLDDARRVGDAQISSRESDLMEESLELDLRKRELDQLKAAGLYYLFLTDFERGCEGMLDAFAKARDERDSFFQDLLVLYLDRFLPGGARSEAFNDVIKAKLDEFRKFLTDERPDFHVALGIMVGRYLVESSQSTDALNFLARLSEEGADTRQRHDLYILRGNACLRAPGKVQDGIHHFQQAVDHAESLPEDAAGRRKFVAEAYKERGYYYRNTGEWILADESYEKAWKSIVVALSEDGLAEDRKEMASIQTNWAYVKGLSGKYSDGLALAESAAAIRIQLQELADAGMSWSVCGEVHRYSRRFERAWDAYRAAEELLEGQRRYWGRLGFIYQEQAICLYQAVQDEIAIGQEPLAEAGRLAGKALELCQTRAIRGYPSALNRAGRIASVTDPDAGLRYLEDGIYEAERLSDGWFWFANLVEYAELSYKQWHKTGHARYREQIDARSASIDEVAANYSFPDLRGRWNLLKAHLAVRDYLDARDPQHLDGALDLFKKGFASLASRHVGSSGAASLKSEFATFQSILSELPPDVQKAWRAELRSAWVDADDVSMVLLARLEELYRPAG